MLDSSTAGYVLDRRQGTPPTYGSRAEFWKGRVPAGPARSMSTVITGRSHSGQSHSIGRIRVRYRMEFSRRPNLCTQAKDRAMYATLVSFPPPLRANTLLPEALISAFSVSRRLLSRALVDIDDAARAIAGTFRVTQPRSSFDRRARPPPLPKLFDAIDAFLLANDAVAGDAPPFPIGCNRRDVYQPRCLVCWI